VNFDTISGSGNLTATLFFSPSLNSLTDDHPLSVAVSLDGSAPQVIQPVPPSSRKGDPPGWGTKDGWVANAVNAQKILFTGVQPGAHKLKVALVEGAVVLQKIVIGVW